MGRTSNVFLLWSRFFGTRGLLYVNDQLLFCFILVYRTGGIMNLVRIDIETIGPTPRGPGEYRQPGCYSVEKVTCMSSGTKKESQMQLLETSGSQQGAAY